MEPTQITAQATSTQQRWKHSRQQSCRCLHNLQRTAVGSSAVIRVSSSIIPRNLSDELLSPYDPMAFRVVGVEFHPTVNDCANLNHRIQVAGRASSNWSVLQNRYRGCSCTYGKFSATCIMRVVKVNSMHGCNIKKKNIQRSLHVPVRRETAFNILRNQTIYKDVRAGTAKFRFLAYNY